MPVKCSHKNIRPLYIVARCVFRINLLLSIRVNSRTLDEFWFLATRKGANALAIAEALWKYIKTSARRGKLLLKNPTICADLQTPKSLFKINSPCRWKHNDTLLLSSSWVFYWITYNLSWTAGNKKRTCAAVVSSVGRRVARMMIIYIIPMHYTNIIILRTIRCMT